MSAPRSGLHDQVPLSGPAALVLSGKHGSPWTPELACREAKRILGLVAEGKDPADKKQKDRSAPTICALADRFLEEHVATKAKDRTYTEYKRLVERIIGPELGRLKVDEVRSSDIERLHLKFRATPYQANRLRCPALQDVQLVWPARLSGILVPELRDLRSRNGAAICPRLNSPDSEPPSSGRKKRDQPPPM